MTEEMTMSLDDLDRLEHILDIIVAMHDSFGISLEESAGRFDRYAQKAYKFVTSELFCNKEADNLASQIYYGKQQWQLVDMVNPAPLPYP